MQRKSSWSIGADIIAFIHLVWAIFFWGGTIAVIFNHAYAPIQAWVLVIAFIAKIPLNNNCILTIIEEKMRRVHDPQWKGNGSFVATYINKLFGTHWTAKKAKTLFLVFYILSCILTVYALLHP